MSDEWKIELNVSIKNRIGLLLKAKTFTFVYSDKTRKEIKMPTDNCFQVFKSFIILFNLFALAPFSKNKYSRCILYIYSFVCVSFLCIVTVLTLIKLDEFGIISNLSATLSTFFTLILNVIHLIIIIQAFLCRHKQFRLWSKFFAIDSLFYTGLQLKNKYYKELRSIQLKIYVLFTVSIGEIILTAHRLFSIGQLDCSWIHTFFTIMVLRVLTLQIIFYVSLLKNRLSVVSNVLDTFCSKLVIQRSNSSENKNKFKELLHLNKIYGILYEINGLINDSFGWSLLVVFIENFLNMTNNGFWFFTSEPDYMVLLHHLYQLLRMILTLFMITHSCYECHRNVSLTF